jgi:hypothetical protein
MTVFCRCNDVTGVKALHCANKAPAVNDAKLENLMVKSILQGTILRFWVEENGYPGRLFRWKKLMYETPCQRLMSKQADAKSSVPVGSERE